MSEQRTEFILREIERIDGPALTNDATLGKHQKMARSPFQFLRGSAQLFYADLADGTLDLPDAFTAPPLTAIMGDCHIENFGLFTEEGSHGERVIWGPNDFDDAAIGHAAFDLLRYLTSLYLIGDYINGLLDGHYQDPDLDPVPERPPLSEKDLTQLCEACLDSYQGAAKAMRKSEDARDTPLDAVPRKHFLARFFKKARKRTASGSRFHDKSTIGKRTELIDGALRFKHLPERFLRLDQTKKRAIHAAFRPYVDDDILDIVRRVGAGTGSNNIDRYYLLIGPTGPLQPDDLTLTHIVEVKQQRTAALIPYFPDLSPVNRLPRAHLTVDCQRQMMRRPDLVLDDVIWQDKHWLVRSRHHARLGIDTADIVGDEKPDHALHDLVTASGHTLAQAHARGDRRSTRFEAAMLSAIDEAGEDLIDTARQYAQQVIMDHTLFCQLLSQQPGGAAHGQ